MNSTSRILVTGAAGFIGGWIVESLFLRNTPVRAGIRQWSSAARIGRFPVEIVPCDVTNMDQVLKAVEGVDYVVHCAFGSSTVTVQGTDNVLAASMRAGVKRVVHLSTIDVYGEAEGLLTEETPVRRTGSEYGDSKIEAEEICQRYARQGLPVVILRPSVVYGPYCKVWISKTAERLQSGLWTALQESQNGICNPVYVTDLVQAIMLGLESPHAANGTYNISGAETPSWNEFFETLSDALGISPPSKDRSMHHRTRVTTPLRSLARFAMRHFGRPLTWIYQESMLARRILKSGESLLKNTPSGDEFAMLGRRARIDISKARASLGYEPRYSLKAGLAMSAQWLKHEMALR